MEDALSNVLQCVDATAPPCGSSSHGAGAAHGGGGGVTDTVWMVDDVWSSVAVFVQDMVLFDVLLQFPDTLGRQLLEGRSSSSASLDAGAGADGSASSPGALALRRAVRTEFAGDILHAAEGWRDAVATAVHAAGMTAAAARVHLLRSIVARHVLPAAASMEAVVAAAWVQLVSAVVLRDPGIVACLPAGTAVTFPIQRLPYLALPIGGVLVPRAEPCANDVRNKTRTTSSGRGSAAAAAKIRVGFTRCAMVRSATWLSTSNMSQSEWAGIAAAFSDARLHRRAARFIPPAARMAAEWPAWLLRVPAFLLTHTTAYDITFGLLECVLQCLHCSTATPTAAAAMLGSTSVVVGRCMQQVSACAVNAGGIPMMVGMPLLLPDVGALGADALVADALGGAAADDDDDMANMPPTTKQLLLLRAAAVDVDPVLALTSATASALAPSALAALMAESLDGMPIAWLSLDDGCDARGGNDAAPAPIPARATRPPGLPPLKNLEEDIFMGSTKLLQRDSLHDVWDTPFRPRSNAASSSKTAPVADDINMPPANDARDGARDGARDDARRRRNRNRPAISKPRMVPSGAHMMMQLASPGVRIRRVQSAPTYPSSSPTSGLSSYASPQSSPSVTDHAQYVFVTPPGGGGSGSGDKQRPASARSAAGPPALAAAAGSPFSWSRAQQPPQPPPAQAATMSFFSRDGGGSGSKSRSGTSPSRKRASHHHQHRRPASASSTAAATAAATEVAAPLLSATATSSVVSSDAAASSDDDDDNDNAAAVAAAAAAADADVHDSVPSSSTASASGSGGGRRRAAVSGAGDAAAVAADGCGGALGAGAGAPVEQRVLKKKAFWYYFLNEAPRQNRTRSQRVFVTANEYVPVTEASHIPPHLLLSPAGLDASQWKLLWQLIWYYVAVERKVQLTPEEVRAKGLSPTKFDEAYKAERVNKMRRVLMQSRDVADVFGVGRDPSIHVAFPAFLELVEAFLRYKDPAYEHKGQVRGRVPNRVPSATDIALKRSKMATEAVQQPSYSQQMAKSRNAKRVLPPQIGDAVAPRFNAVAGEAGEAGGCGGGPDLDWAFPASQGITRAHTWRVRDILELPATGLLYTVCAVSPAGVDTSFQYTLAFPRDFDVLPASASSATASAIEDDAAAPCAAPARAAAVVDDVAGTSEHG